MTDSRQLHLINDFIVSIEEFLTTIFSPQASTMLKDSLVFEERHYSYRIQILFHTNERSGDWH